MEVQSTAHVDSTSFKISKQLIFCIFSLRQNFEICDSDTFKLKLRKRWNIHYQLAKVYYPVGTRSTAREWKILLSFWKQLDFKMTGICIMI